MFLSLGKLCCQVVITTYCEEQQEIMNKSMVKKIADTLRGNFYVDDLLKSFQDGQKAIKLIKDITTMCAKGGF